MRNNCGLISANTSIELVGVFNNFIKNVFKGGDPVGQYSKLEDLIAKYVYDNHGKDDKEDALSIEEGNFIDLQFATWALAIKPLLFKSDVDEKFSKKIWGDNTSRDIKLFNAKSQELFIDAASTTLPSKVKLLYPENPSQEGFLAEVSDQSLAMAPLAVATKIGNTQNISNKTDLKARFANANTAYLLLSRRVSNHIVRNYLIDPKSGTYNTSSLQVDQSVKANKVELYNNLISQFTTKGLTFSESEKQYYKDGKLNDDVKNALDKINNYYENKNITNVDLESWTQTNLGEISNYINYIILTNFDNLLLSYGKGVLKIAESYVNSYDEQLDKPKYILDIQSNISSSIFETGEYGITEEQSSLFKMFISSMPAITLDGTVGLDKEVNIGVVNNVMARLLHEKEFPGAPKYDPTNSMESMKALLEYVINNFTSSSYTAENPKIQDFKKVEKDAIFSVYMYFFRDPTELTGAKSKVILKESLRSKLRESYGNLDETGNFKEIPSFYQLASTSNVVSGMDYYNVIVSNFDKTYLNDYTEYAYDKDKKVVTVNNPKERLANGSEIQFTNNINNFINQEFSANKDILDIKFKGVTLEGSEGTMVRFALGNTRSKKAITVNLRTSEVIYDDGKGVVMPLQDIKDFSYSEERDVLEMLNRIIPQLQLVDDQGNDFYYPTYRDIFSDVDKNVISLAELSRVAGYATFISKQINTIGKEALKKNAWIRSLTTDYYNEDDEEFSIAALFGRYNDISRKIGEGLSIVNGDTHKPVIKVGNVTVPTVGEVRHLYAMPKWRNWLMAQNGGKLKGMPIQSNLFMANPEFLKGFVIRSFVKIGDTPKHSAKMSPQEIMTTLIMHDYISAATKYDKVFIQPTVFADKNSHNSVVVSLKVPVKIPGKPSKVQLGNTTSEELKRAMYLNNNTYYTAIEKKITSTYIPVLEQLTGTKIGNTVQDVNKAMGKVTESEFRNAFYKAYNGKEYLIEDLGIKVSKKGIVGLAPLLMHHVEMYARSQTSSAMYNAMIEKNEKAFAKKLKDFGMKIEYKNTKGKLNPIFEVSSSQGNTSTGSKTIFDKLNIGITAEQFEKQWVNPTTKYLIIHDGTSLNPLLRHFFYMDNYVSENLMQASMGTLHNHPFKGSPDASVEEMESGQQTAEYKRQLQGTPMKPLNIGLINGVGETMKSVFMTDINNPVFTSFGIEDKMTTSDGSAQIVPLQYILQNNSLLENSVGPNAKMFSLFMDPKYNSYGLTKYAEFGITNEMIKNSKGAKYDLSKLIEKSYSYGSFARTLIRGEEAISIPFNILKDFKGRNITIDTVAPGGLFFEEDGDIFQILDLTNELTIINEDHTITPVKGNYNQFSRKVINLRTQVTSTATNIEINNLHQLWKALGGENSVSIDPEGQYTGRFNYQATTFTDSDASHLALAEFVNRVGFKRNTDQKNNLMAKYAMTESEFNQVFPEFKVSKTSFLIDNQSNTWQPLKDMFIGKFIHTSAQKSGAINVHGINNVYDLTKDIYPVDIPAISTGLLMDTDHEVEGSEITRMTQIISAIEFMGESHNISRGVYNAIADVLNIKLKALLDTVVTGEVNKLALYKEVTDNLIKTFNSKDQQSIGKFIGEMVVRENDNMRQAITAAKQQEQEDKNNSAELAEEGEAESVLPPSIVFNGKKMPFSTYMYGSFVSLMSNFLNKTAIRDKQSGIASPIKPSGSMVQVYDNYHETNGLSTVLGKEDARLNPDEHITEEPIDASEISLYDWIQTPDGEEVYIDTPRKLIQYKNTPSLKPVETFKGFWSRGDVEKDTDKVYLFGDNTNDRLVTKYVPRATQAVIRGLDNAIGIDTKKDRGTTSSSYFTDQDFDLFKAHVDEQIDKAVQSGKTIVLPEDGIGTGKAMLEQKAPKLFDYLTAKLKTLVASQRDSQIYKLYGKPRDLRPPHITFNVEGVKKAPMSIYELPAFVMTFDLKDILSGTKKLKDAPELVAYLKLKNPGKKITLEFLAANTRAVNNLLRLNIQGILDRIDTQKTILIDGVEMPVTNISRKSGEGIGPNIYRKQFGLPKGMSVSQVTTEYLYNRIISKAQPMELNDPLCSHYFQNSEGNHIYVYDAEPKNFVAYKKGEEIRDIDGEDWVVDSFGDRRYKSYEKYGYPSGYTTVNGKRIDIIIAPTDTDKVFLNNRMTIARKQDKEYYVGKLYNISDDNNAILEAESLELAQRRYASFKTTLSFIAARIPGQGYQSFTDIDILDFIHTEGNTVMTNHFTSWLKGEDYDIDKGFWLGLTLKKGVIVGWAQEFDYSSEESLRASMSLPYPDKITRTMSTSPEVTLSTEEVNSLFEEGMSKLRSETLVKLGSVNTYDYVAMEGEDPQMAGYIFNKVNEYFLQEIPPSKLEEAIKNKMAWGIRDSVTKPVNLVNTESPISMDDPRDAAKGASTELTSSKNPTSKATFQDANMKGKGVIGIAAVALKIWSAVSYYGNDMAKGGDINSILIGKNISINKENHYIAAQANLNFKAKAATVITDEFIEDQMIKNNIEEKCDE